MNEKVKRKLYVSEELNQSHLTNGTLNVSDDGTVWVVKKLNAHLGNVSCVTGASQDFVDLC